MLFRSNGSGTTYTTPTNFTSIAATSTNVSTGSFYSTTYNTPTATGTVNVAASATSGGLLFEIKPSSNLALAKGGVGGAATSTPTSTGGTGGAGYYGVPATNAITYVSSAITYRNDNNQIVVTVPSVSNGNLMVMFVNASTTTSTWTTPSGWTAGANNANGREIGRAHV